MTSDTATMSFADRLDAAILEKQSPIVVGLDPHLGRNPPACSDRLDDVDGPALRVGPVHLQEVGTVEDLAGLGEANLERGGEQSSGALPVARLHAFEERTHDAAGVRRRGR